MLEQPAVIEHGTSPTGRWLRARRVRIALWAAVIEGALVVFHVISWPAALVIALAVLAAYFTVGHRLRSDTLGQIAWIAAVWQAAVLLVPLLVIFVGTLAIIIVGAIAILALLVLFTSRG